jgi:arylsulfatase A
MNHCNPRRPVYCKGLVNHTAPMKPLTRIVKFLSPVTGAILLTGPCNFLPLQAAENPPNILFILADDLGYGDVSCYNPESKIPTPKIDRLAAQGMTFTDAHSPATVCTPARYSILTGRMAFRTGNKSIFTGAGGPNMIEPGRLTLPEMLRGKGYATAMFGKWHVGLTFLDAKGTPILKNSLEAVKRIDFTRPIPDSPIHRGFDQFFGTACCPNTDWLYAFIDGDRIPVPPTRLLDNSKLPVNPYTEDCRTGMIAPDFDMPEIDMIFLNKSLRFLEEHAAKSPEKPFFLFHSAQAVHLPSLPGKDFQGKTKAGPHGDFIAEFDHIVGTLMAKLDALGLSNNTLVILTSDNGPEVTSVVNMRKDYQHDGARPWRGVKRDQWEGGHRVPFIARWPGTIQPGSRTSQTLCNTDVMATCAAIVGAKLPANAAEDSFDMLPALTGNDHGKAVREFTLHQTWTFDLAIRRGDWKYLDHKNSGGNNYEKSDELKPYILPEEEPDSPGQLYNLAEDPGETHNLYKKNPEIARELKALLDKSKSSGRSAPIR